MYAPGIFAAPEWEEVCNAFKGKFWQDLNVEFLLEHYDALFVFTADAYQYFLPAFLVAITKYYDQADYLVDTVIFIFLPPEPLVRWHKINPFAVLANQAANKCYRQRWEILSTHEREAVSKSLCFLRDFKEEDGAGSALNDLKRLGN